MTVRELVIPFQRNKRSKSVTTAGRPAGRPLILTFLRYIEVDSLRASRPARNKDKAFEQNKDKTFEQNKDKTFEQNTYTALIAETGIISAWFLIPISTNV